MSTEIQRVQVVARRDGQYRDDERVGRRRSGQSDRFGSPASQLEVDTDDVDNRVDERRLEPDEPALGDDDRR
ncbi:hypothetical protein OB955_19455 [Halobacteria archaeon AArc-m2/3/4]|uniref:Uncharacterized protein n=1 Tax=Natronoglomus mannanivorans TaxID=2979990 RepID=A0AAP2Z1P3_9EURY|nr:hypothetical protein [Halobacteria archaeon AArc-xg1-1]MCU4974900.1 hypothetical protein [Halobacteria archaeon AArc-m2/3/4]